MNNTEPPYYFNEQLSRCLGRGSFGAVYLGHMKDTGEPVAIKVEPISTGDKTLLKEVKILEQLSGHPNIVALRGKFNTFTQSSFAMELSNDSLHALMCRPEYTNGLPLQMLFRLIFDVSAALLELKEKNICHRDIKPPNVLVFENEKHPELPTFKLCDFGGSKTSIQELKTVVGTPGYLPPIMIASYERRRKLRKQHGKAQKVSDEPYDPATVDLWCIGTMIYKAATGELPFESNEISDKTWELLVSRPPGTVSGQFATGDNLKEGPQPDGTFILRGSLKTDGSCPYFSYSKTMKTPKYPKFFNKLLTAFIVHQFETPAYESFFAQVKVLKELRPILVHAPHLMRSVLWAQVPEKVFGSNPNIPLREALQLDVKTDYVLIGENGEYLQLTSSSSPPSSSRNDSPAGSLQFVRTPEDEVAKALGTREPHQPLELIVWPLAKNLDVRKSESAEDEPRRDWTVKGDSYTHLQRLLEMQHRSARIRDECEEIQQFWHGLKRLATGFSQNLLKSTSTEYEKVLLARGEKCREENNLCTLALIFGEDDQEQLQSMSRNLADIDRELTVHEGNLKGLEETCKEYIDLLKSHDFDIDEVPSITWNRAEYTRLRRRLDEARSSSDGYRPLARDELAHWTKQVEHVHKMALTVGDRYAEMNKKLRDQIFAHYGKPNDGILQVLISLIAAHQKLFGRNGTQQLLLLTLNLLKQTVKTREEMFEVRLSQENVSREDVMRRLHEARDAPKMKKRSREAVRGLKTNLQKNTQLLQELFSLASISRSNSTSSSVRSSTSTDVQTLSRATQL